MAAEVDVKIKHLEAGHDKTEANIEDLYERINKIEHASANCRVENEKRFGVMQNQSTALLSELKNNQLSFEMRMQSNCVTNRQAQSKELAEFKEKIEKSLDEHIETIEEAIKPSVENNLILKGKFYIITGIVGLAGGISVNMAASFLYDWIMKLTGAK